MTEQEWEDKLDEVQKHSENWYNKWKQSENKIADIKANCDLAIEGRDKKIKELEKENAVLERRIERAKECMKKLLFIINSDPANYNCKGLVQDAEDFIYNRTCNIRQQGEHCISKTRCIMCDKGDGKVK